MINLNEKQLSQLAAIGITSAQLERQLYYFQHGFPFARLEAAATVGHGIHRFTDTEIEYYASIYEQVLPMKKVVKFVPASGAASRMFKHLFQAIDESPNINALAKQFFEGIHEFAFADELETALEKQGLSIEQCVEEQRFDVLLKTFLNAEGMGYGVLPKALLLFHMNDLRPTTALEEQLFEGVQYAKLPSKKVYLHFTISPEHEQAFVATLKRVQPYYEDRFKVKFDISYSFQSKSTDTVAVNLDNSVYQDPQGKMVFRPAGHGALIKNLAEIDGDLIFIKNIDNVVPEALSTQNSIFKKMLGGVLLAIQKEIFELIGLLNSQWNEELKLRVIAFAKQKLFADWAPTNAQEAIALLNRPIRVCGMVKNEGEPGGGPFWLRTDYGITLQIVESSQIDLSDPIQAGRFSEATHFNPVDLVCATKDYNGNLFQLADFVDPETGFITEKSIAGNTVKAQELPGLWNGAMAKWNTVFVEVPIQTFNPVKTINDLLKPNHQ